MKRAAQWQWVVLSMPVLAPLSAQEPTYCERASALAAAVGLVDPTPAPFVAVLTGRGQRRGVGDWQPEELPGVLLHDDGRTFTVLTLRAELLTRQRTDARAPVEHRVAYWPVDRAGVADGMLAQFAERQPESWQTLELGMLAWICGAQRDAGRAERLWRLVETANGGRDPVTAFGAQLGDARANAVLTAFADVQTPLAELQTGLQAWLAAFREHPKVEVVRELADDTAAALAAPCPTGAGIDADIAALIDHFGGVQVDDDPPCLDVQQSGPAARLIAAGAAAVPALLSALTDRRPTRTLWYADDGVRVLRVRQVVRQILQVILAEHLPDEPLAARAQGEHWLDEVRRRGEATMLSERVVAGSSGSHTAARRLAVVAPDRLLPAIVAGYPNAAADWVRADYLQNLATIEGAPVLAFLRAQLATDSLLLVVAAAEVLLQRGQPQGVMPVLLARWRSAGQDTTGSVRRLGTLLVTHGDVAALEAVGERRDRLDGSLLYELGAAEQTKDAALAMARERLLGELLDDHSTPGGCCQPRLCDHAARALARGWPHYYHFDFDALRPDRDAQLHGVRSAFRVRQGLRPLPSVVASLVPAPPGLHEVLARWRREDRAIARGRLLAELTSPSAVAPMLALHADPSLERSPERRLELQGAVSRLGATTLGFEPTEQVAALPAPVATALQALVGRPFDEAALAAALRQLFSEPTPLRTFALRASRATGEAGIRFTVEVEVGPPVAIAMVRRAEIVRAGRSSLLGSTGAGQLAAYQEDRDDEFAHALGQAAVLPGLPAIEALLHLQFVAR